MIGSLSARIAVRARHLRRQVGDSGVLVALVAVSVALGVIGLAWPEEVRPAVLLALPVLIGGLMLPLGEMRLLLLAVAAVLGADILAVGTRALSVGALLVLVTVSATAHELARRRDRFGVREGRPDMILSEVRERLQVQGEVPPLAPGWAVEVAQRSAHDAGMAGDFVSSRVQADHSGQKILDLALVDVSGRGVEAGTRALLLSGAFGGLLGAVPPHDFLSEANRYLIEQRWGEGFATAVYVRVWLDTGQFRVESAGHPPVAHLDAGSGRWRVAGTNGPVLGVFATVGFTAHDGVLRPGDALLMYTDGVVESRSQDIELGLDRLLGAAERLVPLGTFRGGAAYLVDQVPTMLDDDRAVVLIWRER